MDREEFKKLKRGDIVKPISDYKSYVIIGRSPGGYLIGIREVTISNPNEWVKVSK